MKNALIFLLAVMVIGTISAGGQKEAEVTKEPVKIEFWTTQTQSDRMSTIQLLADTFQAINPDIQVVIVPVDENDMPKQVASASAASVSMGLDLSRPRMAGMAQNEQRWLHPSEILRYETCGWVNSMRPESVSASRRPPPRGLPPIPLSRRGMPL